MLQAPIPYSATRNEYGFNANTILIGDGPFAWVKRGDVKFELWSEFGKCTEMGSRDLGARSQGGFPSGILLIPALDLHLIPIDRLLWALILDHLLHLERKEEKG